MDAPNPATLKYFGPHLKGDTNTDHVEYHKAQDLFNDQKEDECAAICRAKINTSPPMFWEAKFLTFLSAATDSWHRAERYRLHAESLWDRLWTHRYEHMIMPNVMNQMRRELTAVLEAQEGGGPDENEKLEEYWDEWNKDKLLDATVLNAVKDVSASASEVDSGSGLATHGTVTEATEATATTASHANFENEKNMAIEKEEENTPRLEKPILAARNHGHVRAKSALDEAAFINVGTAAEPTITGTAPAAPSSDHGDIDMLERISRSALLPLPGVQRQLSPARSMGGPSIDLITNAHLMSRLFSGPDTDVRNAVQDNNDPAYNVMVVVGIHPQDRLAFATTDLTFRTMDGEDVATYDAVGNVTSTNGEFLGSFRPILDRRNSLAR
ncbi:hypothetical protein D6D05_05374 [Aureobasidium pullulans]|nr:hypothetical protein D6D05_05374 [Aureobasidium pullulans]